MRGDSLRDFYAKTLALLGLGLLAGAGALVDYWPVGGELPAVESALALPSALAMPGLPSDTPKPSSVARSAGAVPTLASLTTDAAADVAEPVTEPEPILTAAAPAVTLPSLAVESAASSTLPASVLELMPPVITASEAIPNQTVIFTAQSENPFIGATKSIGRASARAGGAVVHGVAAVAGAVGHVFYR